MMTVKQYFLSKLAEECNEVGQRALKQMQFGRTETQASGPSDTKTGDAALTNDLRLRKEYVDLLTVVSILVEIGEMPSVGTLDAWDDVEEQMEAKRKKLWKYLKWSQDCGQVEDTNKEQFL